MILKTKIKYEVPKDLSKLSEQERKIIEGKRIIHGEDYVEDDLYTDEMRDGIIDTDNNHQYMDIDDGLVQMRDLLGGQFMPVGQEDFNILFEQVIFEGTIEEVYNKLINK